MDGRSPDPDSREQFAYRDSERVAQLHERCEAEVFLALFHGPVNDPVISRGSVESASEASRLNFKTNVNTSTHVYYFIKHSETPSFPPPVNRRRGSTYREKFGYPLVARAGLRSAITWFQQLTR